jgi:putative ABC transport system permease protein
VSPRYQKVRRDLWVARSRILMMIIAIALSLTAVGTVLTSKAINDRELQANYLGTHPASATIEVQGSLNRAILDAVRAQPGVLDTAIRRTLSARIKTNESDSWRQLLLFVIPRDDPLRISTFTVERGAWPPADDELFMERDALGLMNAHVEQTVIVKAPDGTPKAMRISGVVHDPGLSPATEEDTEYGYISDSALATLGESAALDQLKLVIDDGSGTPSADRNAIEETASRVSNLLQSQGMQVKNIQIPPPYQHPHQSQMDTLLFMFLVFGGVTLLLSAILMAGLLNQMLTQQIPQIGVLKVLGAGTGQVLQLYLVMVLFIAGVATAISIPAGIVLGRAFAGVIANSQLNFDITSDAVPGWVFAVLVVAGIGVPVLIALVPLLRASRITVRAAIDERGIDESTGASNPILNRLLASRWLDRSVLAAIRNVFRRKGRLALSVTLLTVAGAMFTGGINTAAALQDATDQGVAIQGYDVEVQLNTPESIQKLDALVGSLDGVAHVESWPMLPVATTTDDTGIDLVSTYPDKGHKSFTLEGPRATVN